MPRRLTARSHKAQSQEFLQPFPTRPRKIVRQIRPEIFPAAKQIAPMRRFFTLALSALFLCGATTLGRTQGVVKAKHGDWELRCETPPGALHEQCALLQSVTAEDRPNVNLVVIVLKTADGKNRLLRVIAPLGVLSAVRARAQDRQYGCRPRRFRALPADRLRRRSGDGRQAHPAAEKRPQCHIHYLPNSGRRNWHPPRPQGLRRRVRRPALRPAARTGGRKGSRCQGAQAADGHCQNGCLPAKFSCKAKAVFV